MHLSDFNPAFAGLSKQIAKIIYFCVLDIFILYVYSSNSNFLLFYRLLDDLIP